MRFTTSWDDGHPLDLRLAELLNRHGFRGTFYVPITNREGLPVLSVSGVRELDTLGEVGSHTHDHTYLPSVPEDVARQQIHDGRVALEDAVGHRIAGFCYPGGKFRRAHRLMVEADGFEYARTTRNFTWEPAGHSFEQATTLQFYPHARLTYVSNWVRHGQWLSRLPLAARAYASADLLSLLKTCLLYARSRSGVFHLWGHSWELDQFGGWSLLDEFLAFASDHVERHERITNGQALNRDEKSPSD